ncbi:Ground-like domain family protein [Acanthocheilonema viteae]
MLIFVILSTTEAYFSKSPQLQSRSYPCHLHSQALLCRLPAPPHTTPSSSAPSKPLFHLPSRLPNHATIPYSNLPPCVALCPPLPSCPPSSSVFCLFSCPLPSSLSSPGLPTASPLQYHYDSTKPISSSSSYLDRISGSYQDSYKSHPKNGNENVTDLPDSSFSEKSKPTKLLPSTQQFNQPSDIYLPNIIHENASTPLQEQLSQITEKDESVAEMAKDAGAYEVKYLIKSNCSSNDTNCVIDNFIVPPENDCCTNCLAPCRFRYIQKTSLRSDQIQEVDPVCNNELLKQIIDKQVDDDINKSKIRIERTARWFLGELFGVICGNDNFAYIIQTKDFCQHRKGNVTCYVFRPFRL